MKRLRTSSPTEAFRYVYQLDSTVIVESFMYLSDGRFTAVGSISGNWSFRSDGLFVNDGQFTEYHNCGVGGGKRSYAK